MAPTPTTFFVRRNARDLRRCRQADADLDVRRPAHPVEAFERGRRPARARGGSRERPRRSAPRAASGAERSPVDGAARRAPGTAPHPSSPIDHPDAGSTRWSPPSCKGVLAPGYRRDPMGLPRSLAPLRHRRYAMFWTGAFMSNIGTWMETVARRHLRHHVDRPGGLDRDRRRGRLPARTRSSAPFGGALADRSRAGGCCSTTTTVQTVLAGIAVLPRRDRRSPPGRRHADRARQRGARRRSASRRSRRCSPISCRARTSRRDRARLGAVEPRARDRARARRHRDHARRLRVGVRDQHRQLPRGHRGDADARAPAAAAGRRASRSRPRSATGSRFACDEPGIRSVIGDLCLNTLLAAPFIALVPAMASKVLHSGESGTAVLVTAQGIGAVMMALLLGGAVARFGNRRVLRTVLTGLPIALVLYALAPTLWLCGHRDLLRRPASTSAASRASRRSRSCARRRRSAVACSACSR